MARLLLLIFAGITIALPAQVDPRKVAGYEVTFTIRNAGLEVEGTFTGLEASIRYHADKPSEMQIDASVDAGSVNTGIQLRDRHLQGREYFDTAKSPRIAIRSKQIKAIGKNKYEGIFVVVIRDVSKEVVIPFSATRKGRKIEFRANFRLNRLDFGLGKESLILSDDVNVRVQIATEEPGEKHLSIQ